VDGDIGLNRTNIMVMKIDFFAQNLVSFLLK